LLKLLLWLLFTNNFGFSIQIRVFWPSDVLNVLARQIAKMLPEPFAADGGNRRMATDGHQLAKPSPGRPIAICDAARGRAPGRSCPDNRGRGPVLERGGPTNAAEGTPLAAEGTPTTTEGQGGAGGPARNPI